MDSQTYSPAAGRLRSRRAAPESARHRNGLKSGTERTLLSRTPAVSPPEAPAESKKLPTLTVVVPATNDPPTLDECLAAIRGAVDPPDEVIVVKRPTNAGPAEARNAGACLAKGDVLVFVDADVVVSRDAFSRIRSAFAEAPQLTALFGSYDAEPAATGAVSGFRNLLHHHVHQQAGGDATTFWAGLGAVSRIAFLEAGGFDAERFAIPSIEDIEFGMRLSRRGGNIQLDPLLQGKHLKRWSLMDMLQTDFRQRGVPWVALIMKGNSSSEDDSSPSSQGNSSPSSALNLSWRHRLSAAAAVIALAGLPARRPRVSAVAILALVSANFSFYTLLARRRGPVQAVAGVGLHVLHHCVGVASVPTGITLYVQEAARAEDPLSAIDHDPLPLGDQPAVLAALERALLV